MTSIQTVRPAAKYLFCKPDEAITMTKSGFLIAGEGEKPKTAQVINTGARVEGFKSKDIIIYKPYSTTDIKLNDEEYFLIAEDDVLGAVINQ